MDNLNANMDVAGATVAVANEEEKKRKSKVLVALACLALALMLAVGGVVAYLTDTASITNQFTIAQVGDEEHPAAFALTLTEPSFVEENAKDVLPGQTIAKDPTVTNKGRLDQWDFVKVQIPQYMPKDGTAAVDLFTYTLKDGWTQIGNAEVKDGVKTVIYKANDKLAGSTAAPHNKLVLFDEVVAAEFTAADEIAVNQQIIVTAMAVQTEGFDTADEAWTACGEALKNA